MTASNGTTNGTGNGERPFDLGGRYLERGIIGVGTQGIVYRVFDTREEQELALKTIRNISATDRQQLKAEYRSICGILHDNLVRLHDLHVDGEQCFFTMDLIDGQPFTDRFQVDRSKSEAEQAVAIRKICSAGIQLTDALRALHAHGKCHRDVKPTNILVTSKDRVVLLDFGLAGHIARARELDTTRGFLVGTLAFMAPEQYDDSRPVPAADWYSAGLVLYQALTGVLPFEGNLVQVASAKQRPPPRASKLLPSLPLSVDDLLLAMLDPRPENRPSGEEIRAVLSEYAEQFQGGQSWQTVQVDSERLFVGREEEIERLKRAHSGVVEKRQFVTAEVVGASGIGKTALIRRFLKTVEQTGGPTPLILAGRCDPHESIPYKAFDAVIDDLARYWLQLSDSDSAALRPEESAEALAVLFPELGRVPALRTGAAASMRGDPRVLRQTGFQALCTVVSRISQRVPVIIWVDDMQWADADSVALIDAVFGVEDPPKVLLLLSRRPDHETAQPELLTAVARAGSRGTSLRIDLSPLESAPARLLARAIVERAGAEESELIRAIVGEAAGVPYLLAELAHFAIERRATGTSSLGTTAAALMRERLNTLSPEDRAIVELAAVSGARLTRQILLSAADAPSHGRFRDLCVLRLLRRTDTCDQETFQIYHDRLREFVVAALSPELAVRHNLALVRAMEAGGSTDAERMLDHARAARDRPRTRHHAILAARRAETALAFEQAARFYRVALEHTGDEEARANLLEQLAEALANAGQSTRAAPAFEQALAALAGEAPQSVEHHGFLRRRAGEQYLKAGHFDDGFRLMQAFLADTGVRLPKTGTGALFASAGRRARLYIRGFEFTPQAVESISPGVRMRLDDLWASTTALSMMDPVRSDAVGLLHFIEALRAGHPAHVARSLGYEAAFAALIGGPYMRKKAQDLLRRNREALASCGTYEHAFYRLGAGTAYFFFSDWDESVRLCDAAAASFRKECRGAEYEAAVALVFSLQALGQAGKVAQLVARIPEAIREADARGDLFAANNYRGGFHALGRIAAGLLDDVCGDLRKVVETWTSGFYQMHAYYRVFAGVAADLYLGQPASALERIELDWPALKAGLFLHMELPAMELRWTRARASLGVARKSDRKKRQELVRRVNRMIPTIAGSTAAAARPHAASLRAAVAAIEGRTDHLSAHLREALEGYTAANMAIHREVSRWVLGKHTGGAEGLAQCQESEKWMRAEGVPEMKPLVATLAPGLEVIGG